MIVITFQILKPTITFIYNLYYKFITIINREDYNLLLYSKKKRYN